ncbi:hypothetical protein OIV83_003412 [Microbotryomycetes sp. JL201]|nr:hypothetical protein OIV83_003412 [Microbotryomycetes sp. JL201]
MKAYVIEKAIKPEELRACLQTSAPAPKCGPKDVLVDVDSAGLNFFDILQIQDKYQVKPAKPYVLGTEFSGRISQQSPIPEGCMFQRGDYVFGAGQGSFAEQIAVEHDKLVPLPANVSMEEAAGLFITMPTSYAALVIRANVQPGEWVLVHAAAGGVGLAAVQIAKALGARVIACCSTQDKLDVAKRFGADYGVNYATGKSGDWQNEVKKITNGHGVDVVYDPVGMIVPSLKVAAWNCRLVVVGFAAGSIEKIPANLVLLKNVAVTGVHWGAYLRNEPEAVPQVWMGLLNMLSEGKIRGTVYDKLYHGLETVPEGLAALGSRGTWGKVIVKVNSSKQSKI